MYRVVKSFRDLHDDNYLYEVGDIFPRKGIIVSETRLKKLAGNDNRQGVPLIKLTRKTELFRRIRKWKK